MDVELKVAKNFKILYHYKCIMIMKTNELRIQWEIYLGQDHTGVSAYLTDPNFCAYPKVCIAIFEQALLNLDHCHV
jgi:hypothetical protein